MPSSVSPVGGIVLDLVASNGVRVVSQTAPSALFLGMFDDGNPVAFRGNPGTIGLQAGFSPEILDALGNDIGEIAVRLTLFDGDTALGDFDRGDNQLLLNGIELGDFSAVVTEEVSEDGLDSLSLNPDGGFRNERLDTGFFYSNSPTVTSAFLLSLRTSGTVVYQLNDVEPFDNFFDFTQGLSGAALDASLAPTLTLPPSPDPIEVPVEPEPIDLPEFPPVAEPSREPSDASPALDPRLLGISLQRAVPFSGPIVNQPGSIQPGNRVAVAEKTEVSESQSSLTRFALTSGGGGLFEEVILPGQGGLSSSREIAAVAAVANRISSAGLERVGQAFRLVDKHVRSATNTFQQALDSFIDEVNRSSKNLLQQPAPATGPPVRASGEESENPSQEGVPPPAFPNPTRARAATWTVMLVVAAVVVQRRWSGQRGSGWRYLRFRRRRGKSRPPAPNLNPGG